MSDQPPQKAKDDKRARGRPSSYSDEIADDICRLISEGENLNRISQLDRFPTQQTIYNWLDNNKEFFEKYERARARRADARADRIDGYRERLLEGTLQPDVARVVVDIEKWQAGRENPKRYGDKTLHTGADGESPVDFTLTVTRRDDKAD